MMMSVSSETLLLNSQENVLKLQTSYKQATKKEGKGNKPNTAETLSNEEINISTNKTAWDFQTKKHW